MSTNKNHAMRSKRSSHNSKPFMMFIRNARIKKLKKENKGDK